MKTVRLSPSGLLVISPQLSNRRGFTLVELMISTAIIGILAAMMFTNFSQEKERNAIKGAVQQLQTDLQAMQTNAQGGIDHSVLVEDGYGIYIPVRPASSYTTFSDTARPDQIYNNSGTSAADVDIAVRNFPADVQIEKITDTTSGISIPGGLSILNFLQTGQSTHTESDQLPDVELYTPTTRGNITLYLKHSRLNVCYAINVTVGVGTVSQRKLDSC